MKCDICGKENDCVEINFCKLCAFEFNNNTKKIKNDLAIYKKALELACEKYIDVDGISYVLRDDYEDYFGKSDEQIQKETIAYFISQAKKELEEQNV